MAFLCLSHSLATLLLWRLASTPSSPVLCLSVPSHLSVPSSSIPSPGPQVPAYTTFPVGTLAFLGLVLTESSSVVVPLSVSVTTWTGLFGAGAQWGYLALAWNTCTSRKRCHGQLRRSNSIRNYERY